MANDGRAKEAGLSDEQGALMADESLTPVFRGFIQSWARKIESLERGAESFPYSAEPAEITLRH